MKKVHIGSLMLLTALFSVNTFAGELSFDLSNKDQADAKDPYFHCDVVKDAGVSIGTLSSTSIKFTSDAPINLGKNGKIIDGLSVNNIKNKYFRVEKDQRGEGHVSYSTNNGSEILCTKGTGDNRTEY